MVCVGLSPGGEFRLKAMAAHQPVDIPLTRDIGSGCLTILEGYYVFIPQVRIQAAGRMKSISLIPGERFCCVNNVFELCPRRKNGAQRSLRELEFRSFISPLSSLT